MEWSNVRTMTLVPAKPVREHWLPLSNLDRVVMPTYVKVLLMYNSLAGDKDGRMRTFADVLETLKFSLRRVLVDFYPMAGKLGVQEHGLVNLHCDGSGAIFTEASVDKTLESMDIIGNISVLSGLDAAELGPGPLFVPSRDLQIPALIVQVTHFACNNIVIAVNWHHTVADIYSGCHFLKSWAELAFGSTQPSLRPVHSRHLVKARNELDITAAEKWSNISRIVPGPRDVRPDPPTEFTAFTMSRAAEKSLEREANRGVEEESGGSDRSCTEASGSGRFTPTESVLAHFWRLLAKVRRAEEPDDEDNVSRLFMFVEGRRHLNLPPGYFGNVVGCACAVSTEESLANGSLATSAGVLQDAVNTVSNPEFFHSLIDWVEAQRLSSVRHEAGISFEHYVAATIWTFQPLFDLDFGWGKPASALTSPAPRRLFDSLIILPGPSKEADQVALLQIRKSCLQSLEADADFTSNFRVLPNSTLLLSPTAH